MHKGDSEEMKVSKAAKSYLLLLLAFVFVFGNASLAQAVAFDDVASMDGEASVSKLVSLGVMSNPGESFDPEGALTRGELAHMVSKSLTLSSGTKPIKVKDLGSKNPQYPGAVKLVANGYFALDKAGNFQPKKAVTYAELSKVLAQQLGLKPHWTNRPVDFLFYLDRKGVLSIDTDLDAEVTRVEAAVVYDTFLAKKGLYNTVEGLISNVDEAKKVLTVKTADGEVKVGLNALGSVFVDGQSQDFESLFVGYPVTLTLDKAGKGAFVAASQTSSETGVLSFVTDGSLEDGAGKLKIGDTLTKNVTLDPIVRALPNAPEEAFSLALLKQYNDAKATISGTVEFSLYDEVTVVTAQIDKVEGKVVSATEAAITVSFGKFTATFAIDENTVIEGGKLADLVKDAGVTVTTTAGVTAAKITIAAAKK